MVANFIMNAGYAELCREMQEYAGGMQEYAGGMQEHYRPYYTFRIINSRVV